MKKRVCQWIGLYLVALSSGFGAGGELGLGVYRLLTVPAETLQYSEPVETGLKSQFFVADIGGIAFDKIADPNLAVTDFDLQYQPERPDGFRCGLMLNSRPVQVNLPDWILLPTAQLAESPYYSWFTLFGHLTDSAREKQFLDKKARILNYHPALQNTLLGLRLFQMDILILYDCSPLLPLEKNCYPLGLMESVPDGIVGYRNYNQFNSEFYQFEKELGKRHRSYVISDYLIDILFSVINDSLSLSGNPHFYFWAYPFDNDQFNQKNTDDSLMQSMQRAFDAGLTESPPRSREEILIDSVLRLEEEYHHSYRLFDSDLLNGLKNEKGEDTKRYYLRQYRITSLLEFYLKAKASMKAHQVVHLKACDQFIQDRYSLLRSINPAVWDAAVQTMRYTAFFRYCKFNHPLIWKKFIQQIIDARTTMPEIITPTVMIHRDSLID